MTAELFKTSDAAFNVARSCRFWLWRMWDASRPAIVWCGLNPSVADESSNDPTIRREIGFSKLWGYGALYKVNLYPTIATNPDDLVAEESADRIANYRAIEEHSRGRTVVLAWGANKMVVHRALLVAGMIKSAGASRICCLGRSKDGHPLHPLYLAANTPLVDFELGGKK